MKTGIYDPAKGQLVPKEITEEIEAVYLNANAVYPVAQELHDAMLAAAPEAPAAEPVNAQLLDALKILVKFNTRDWYDGAYSPVEIRIAKAAIAAAEKELK